MKQLRFKLAAPPKKPRRGRPPKPGAGIAHRARPELASRFPVHVTLRLRKEVWSLRSRRCFTALKLAFAHGRDRFGFRLNEYSVQGNHIHLICEATDATALSRGMQGLAVRMARALNHVMNRRGTVFADRFHSRILRTPPEVRNALHYVLFNHHHHAAQQNRALSRDFRDPYSSLRTPAPSATESPPTIRPRTWLLQQAVKHL